jgi:hypothetical protein
MTEFGDVIHGWKVKIALALDTSVRAEDEARHGKYRNVFIFPILFIPPQEPRK